MTLTSLKTVFQKCPKCDGVLHLIKGKYGEFYGCTNYPSCSFTAKACPNCGAVLEWATCDDCGYTLPKRNYGSYSKNAPWNNWWGDCFEEEMSWLDCSDFIPDGSD